jgi:hypothetical protein
MTDQTTMELGLRIGDLEAQNAKLRAEIENLQAPRPAPTITDIIGPEAFERMVELYPSFRESGTPTKHTDAASEVLWSCIRMMGRLQKQNEPMQQRLMEALADYGDVCAKYERATSALAEYAMRAVEEYDA